MATYYVVFAVFCTVAVILKIWFVDDMVDSLPKLIGYGMLLYPTLLAAYFLTLFATTRGMKYFVARKPAIYNLLTRNKHHENHL